MMGSPLLVEVWDVGPNLDSRLRVELPGHLSWFKDDLAPLGAEPSLMPVTATPGRTPKKGIEIETIQVRVNQALDRALKVVAEGARGLTMGLICLASIW